MFPLLLLDNVTHASLTVVTLFGLDACTEGPVFNKTQLLYMYITVSVHCFCQLLYLRAVRMIIREVLPMQSFLARTCKVLASPCNFLAELNLQEIFCKIMVLSPLILHDSCTLARLIPSCKNYRLLAIILTLHLARPILHDNCCCISSVVML